VHEHLRPDRNSCMTLSCPGGTCAPVVVANTATLPGTSLNWGGSYDVNSLVHYGLKGTFLDGGKSYSFNFNLQSGVIYYGPAQFPSHLDVQRVCDIYYEDCHGICGDGIVSPGFGEECDDGNNSNGDSCSSSCKNEPPPVLCAPKCQPFNHVCGTGVTCTTFDTLPNGFFPHTGQSFCMCQAGFKVLGRDLSGKNQYRVEWQNGFGGQTHRVSMKPGQTCEDPCGDNQCSEVPIQNSCG
jgi:cysteine-rich repeat protein